jgi:hypothetical protein
MTVLSPFRAATLYVGALLSLVGCGSDYPEVVVVNELDVSVLVREVSFNGCKWDTVLAFGEATSPQSCLSGDDRIHFQKLGAAASDPDDPTAADDEPVWFNYQTSSLKRVDDGSFSRFVLTPDDLEQDFSVPGPYGH